MTFSPPASLIGQTLGQYRVVHLIGQGGMGEVYRAEDLRLNRTVAIKVLPSSFVAGLERVKRFEREAQAASAINHPHIAAIYDVGYEAGIHFIAMEYVDGDSLPAWLSREGLTLGEVLLVLEQVGDALAKAHHAGIVHRDVKPANVIVSRSGYAKLLDFGLAKVSGESGPYTDSDIRERLSKTGAVMGTLAYMSPEQARGLKLDRRSDIFSFGIVMYEAVAGTPPFAGDSGIEAVSAVLRDDPIPRLRDRPGVPRELVRFIAKALEKEPARRYQFMDDLLVDLRAVRRGVESGEAEGAEAEPSPLAPWLWAAGGLLGGLLVGALAISRFAGTGAPAGAPPLLEAGLLMRPLTFGGARHRGPAMSPAGDLVAYASDRSGSFDIMVQQVATGRPLRVTEDGGDELDPAFSPDGQTLAFATAGGMIQTVPALGGTVRTLAHEGADLPIWSADGQKVLYRQGRGLHAVSRTGGESIPVVESVEFPVLGRGASSPDGRWVVFLSLRGGRHVLARVPSAGGTPEAIGADLQALGWPTWTADGRWIFGTMGPPREDGNEIWAVPVDPATASLRDPVRVLGGVLNYVMPSVSRDQRKIAFEVQDVSRCVGRIALASSRGAETPAAFAVDARLFQVVVSHSGTSLAVVTDRGGQPALWRADAEGRGIQPLREGPGADEDPAWSPDDSRIAVSHIREDRRQIAILPASGGPLTFLSAPEVLAGSPAWSPDGASIAFVAFGAGRGSIRVVPASGGPERVVAAAPRRFQRLAWSPDGRWIAAGFRSDKGAWCVGVVSSAGGEVREMLSGARAPLWLPDGRLVFVREGRPGTDDLWSVPVGPDGTPRPGGEKPLTRLPSGLGVGRDGASTDGRFLHFALRELKSDDIWLAEAP